jgi:hypothetical protein
MCTYSTFFIVNLESHLIFARGMRSQSCHCVHGLGPWVSSLWPVSYTHVPTYYEDNELNEHEIVALMLSIIIA